MHQIINHSSLALCAMNTTWQGEYRSNKSDIGFLPRNYGVDEGWED